MYVVRRAVLKDLSGIFMLGRRVTLHLRDKGLDKQVSFVPDVSDLVTGLQNGMLFVGISEDKLAKNVVSFALMELCDGVGKLDYIASSSKGAGASLLRYVEGLLYEKRVRYIYVEPHPTLGPYFGRLGYRAEVDCYCKALSLEGGLADE